MHGPRPGPPLPHPDPACCVRPPAASHSAPCYCRPSYAPAVASLAGEPDAATVQSQAAEVDAAIDYMFENCSLPTEPDVALHAVLARLMAGSQALQADPSDIAPVHDMHGAVANYEALFNDPDAG